MDKMERVKAFAELYHLITYYYEYRDMPVKEDFDFFAEVKKNCDLLDLDFDAFVKEFKLNKNLW